MIGGRDGATATALVLGLAAMGCDATPRHGEPGGAVVAQEPRASAPSRPVASRAMSQAAYDGWRQPDAVIAALGLSPGQVVADVGAGKGYLSGRLARAVGPTGRVVATDIDPDALAA